MHLVLTHYVDRHPDHVKHHLAASIDPALRAAAERVRGSVSPTDAAITDDQATIHGGLDLLDGTAIRWDGDADLTAVRFTVPWSPDVHEVGRRVLAANRFAQVLADDVRNAA